MAIALPSEDDILTQDALLRAALRGEQDAGKSITIRAEQLHAALQRANDAVRAEHQLATSIWRSPLSLFDGRAETAALNKGIPSWAVDAVLKAQSLGSEAAQLDDRTDAYKAQIAMAKREGRGIARAALLKQLEQLDSLASRYRAQLPLLRAARASFDAPEAETPRLPPSAASAAELAEAEAERRGGAPSLGEAGVRAEACEELEAELPICILEERPAEPPARGRGFWRSVVRRSQERMPLLESALDAGVGRLISALESMGMAQAPAPPSSERLGEAARVLALPWEERYGKPAPWLDVEDSAEERRQLARLLEERDSPSAAGDGSAKSRWERCRRRTDRRWTLA